MGTESGGEVGAECNCRSAKGGNGTETSWYYEGYDSSIILRAFVNHQREVPGGYIAGG